MLTEIIKQVIAYFVGDGEGAQSKKEMLTKIATAIVSILAVALSVAQQFQAATQ